MNLRPLELGDVEAAGVLLYEATRRAALEHGAPAPWRDVAEATELVESYRVEGGMVADVGGALAGVGFVRRRGDAATVGPLAAAAPGRGTGGRILDELIAQAEAAGALSLRLFHHAWNPGSFALYAGRSFAAADVIACVERPPALPPRLDASRGLELAPFRPADLPEVVALDQRLTGLERAQDLARAVRLCARRRGALVGFLGAAGGALGPGLALDAADLGALIARALRDLEGPVTARLSTAAPTMMLVALGLGFRMASLGTLMVRGVTAPARPPQIFGLSPEIL